MSEFLVYLRLGFEHIADLKGYDHIVFIVALTAVYSLSQWKQVLWLVTAFTIGHSVTLALATLRLVTVDSDLVEILIPATILIVAILDILESRNQNPEMSVAEKDRTSRLIKYAMTFLFGLIHGLGFSTFLRAILGAEESIVLPLLAFNLGLEFGQIAILAAILVISYLIIHLTPISQRIWSGVLAVTSAIIAITLLVSRLISV